uniref:Protein Lines C-terminal domain-containing protein n=1 Tax=Hordeum vulgare subsp. vulgare TaxID=112509 RepID=A0A8I6ZAF8_HORVV
MEDMDRRDVFVKLADVIPRLASYLQEQQHIPKSLSQYSKHKILVVFIHPTIFCYEVKQSVTKYSSAIAFSMQMLMIRLKPHIQQNCSHIVCLLKLLRHHFQSLLHEPMFQHSTKLENCLEGSPFLLSGVGLGELQDKSTRHLQRQAMYLFLSCSIFLACSGNDSRLNCSCKSDHKGQGCTDNCNYFGLSEISVWFQRCCLDEILDSKSSTDIVLCFLQLYMEEDDMLFIILLQLLDAPLISLAIDKMETKWTSELIGAKLFSTIFDPVYIFHQWLSLLSQSTCYTSYSLHYDDHFVLVDYLIAKDVGVHYAQYLLRCLRLVSRCWDAFVDDSVYEAQIQKLNCKRQRIFKNINSFTGSSMEGTKLGSAHYKESKRKEPLFLSAKVCLLSFKRTLEDLHKKDLFPYNPKPLLKSLARFEELCLQY